MSVKQARLFFLSLLVASMLLILYVNLPGSPVSRDHIEKDKDTLTTILIVSQISAPVISVLGLLSTIYFSWRQDRREHLKQALELRSALINDIPTLSGSRKPNPRDCEQTGAANKDERKPISI